MLFRSYQARGKFVVKGRATAWSSWVGASTPAATFIPGYGSIFTSVAPGLAPAGGSTPGTFLRYDGTFATPAGGATITQVTVTFTTPSRAAFFDVAVTATVGQKVVASVSLDMPSGWSEDELEMDPIMVAGRVVSTNLVRLAVSSPGILSGQRNINLMVT